MTEIEASTFESEFAIIKNALFSKPAETEKRKCPYHIVLLLSITFGWIGLDRYYLGKTGTGILKTITLGGLGIWWMIDIFLILFNRQSDALGQELEGADEKDPTVLTFLTMSGLFH